MSEKRKTRLLGALGVMALLPLVSACDGVTGHVSTGVYYDSMMWNDYYYPRPDRPNPPPMKPVHPIAPVPPPSVRPPIAPRPTPLPAPAPRPMPRGR